MHTGQALLIDQGTLAHWARISLSILIDQAIKEAQRQQNKTKRNETFVPTQT